MSNYSKIIEEDCSHIIKRVGSSLDYLKNKSILITGANGFLCSYFVDVINQWNKSLEPSNRCFVHAMDNFSSSKQTRLKHLMNENEITYLLASNDFLKLKKLINQLEQKEKNFKYQLKSS